MKTAGIYVAAVGTELPERVSVLDAVAEGRCTADTQRETGVVTVGVAGDVPAPELGARAARQALERSGHDAAEIAALFYGCTWHQGPDGWSPQYYVLKNSVGTRVPAFELRQGCNGIMAGLDVAASYLKAEPSRTAAIVATADNFGTPGLDRFTSVASSILGDGAAALVLSKRAGFAELLAVNLESLIDLEEMERFGEELFPPAITDGRGMNHRERIHKYMDSWEDELPPFFSLLLEHVPAIIHRTLADAGVDLADIRRIVHINVTSVYFEELIVKPLGLDASIGSHEFGNTVGHMGGADPLASFDHLVRTQQVGPGDHVMFFATAPGHSLSCAVVKVLEHPEWSAPVAE